jgi:hypothetical protein
MAANIKTINEINRMHEVLGPSSFSEVEWNAISSVRFATARKYADIVEIKEVCREYYSMAEIVEKLNACAGDDCYACDWHYQIDDQGRVYQEFESVSYHFA